MRLPRPLTILLLAAASASGVEKVAPTDVGIDQRIGERLPMGAEFRPADGGPARPLGAWFRSGRPAILVMGYYGCPQLCTVVMNGLVESLTRIRPDAGEDFDVLFVSVDPGETPELAAEKKRNYVRGYGKPDSAPGWHFLTGERGSIRALAGAVGFRYAHDEERDEYAHGSGFAVVTPEGRVSRYFYGIEFAPDELAAALDTAAAGNQGEPVRELLLMCYHYNPLKGPHGLLIWRVLQVAALATLGGLAWFVIRNLRREKARRKEATV